MMKKKVKNTTITIEGELPDRIGYNGADEFLQKLGYERCSSCEEFVQKSSECQVCGDSICDDCRDDHAYAETGL